MALRPDVEVFARLMEARLQEFDGIHGPESYRDGTCDPLALIDRAQANLDGLRSAVIAAHCRSLPDRHDLADNATDTANLVMMALAVLGLLGDDDPDGAMTL